MHIESNREDFPKKHNKPINVYACCSCCCCIFWIGGLLGGVMGAAMTAENFTEANKDPLFKEYLGTARKWYWSSFFVSAFIFALTGPIAFLMPILNFACAAIVCSIAINTRIPDEKARKLINKRNNLATTGSFAGYCLGFVILMGLI